VLFARSDSIYKTIEGCDVWDESRNATNWQGGCPAVAHPPCRTWGRLRRLATKAPDHEHELAIWAVKQVRAWGGVLEHPMGSTLFKECGLPIHEGLPDEYGGVTIEVDQYHWGHLARKRTWLYVVGTRKLPPMPRKNGRPTHVVASYNHGKRDRSRPWLTQAQNEATPLAFAQWMVDVARMCKGHNVKLTDGGPKTL
jgi:hypothetical protein